MGGKPSRRSTGEHPFADTDEVFRAEMPSLLGHRERVIQQVFDRLGESGWDLDPYFDRLSLDEILANAIVHGNREDPTKIVTVRAFSTEDRWGVEIADEGTGFPWDEWMEMVKAPMDPSRPSGRGLALIAASGFKLHFLDHGRRVVMVRERGPRALPGEEE